MLNATLRTPLPSASTPRVVGASQWGAPEPIDAPTACDGSFTRLGAGGGSGGGGGADLTHRRGAWTGRSDERGGRTPGVMIGGPRGQWSGGGAVPAANPGQSPSPPATKRR